MGGKLLVRHWLNRFLDNCHMAQQSDDITVDEYEMFEQIREMVLEKDAERRGIYDTGRG